LSADQIGFLQQTIIGSGALKKTEAQIEDLGNKAIAELQSLEIEASGKSALIDLANQVMNRDK
jgi:geranylgeranyl pyrophosphate synthase